MRASENPLLLYAVVGILRDGFSGWLPTSYLTHLLATTTLLHAKLPLPETFSLLLSASSS